MVSHAFLFNLTPSGTAFTSGNTVSSTGVSATTVSAGSGGSIVSSTAQVQEGATSALLTPGGSQTQVLRLPFPAPTRQGALCLYHRRATLGSLDLLNVRYSGGQLFRIGISGTGSVQVKDASNGNVFGSTSPGSAWGIDRWNRIEFKFDNSGGTAAGTIDLAVYVGNETIPTGTLSLTGANLGSQDAVSIDVGSPNAPTLTIPHWIDAVQLGSNQTTFFGPYVDVPPTPIINSIAGTSVGPGEQKSITAALASGPATSWSWRQIDGPPLTLSPEGATCSIVGPSILPPSSSIAVLGVKAFNGISESLEETVSVTVLPQLSWTRVHGGNWVGSRVVPA